ncbi:hypothetical protein HY933_00980 [Candidatus Falkowbacteria bacterium]|nr:hypothetical protein [Candidatus Falkowbacteria bacterium]
MFSEKFARFPAQDVREMPDRVVKNGPEIITSPESESLLEFHDFLLRNFKPGEVEPLKTWQEEMKQTDPKVRFIATVLREPLDKQKPIVGAAYGSVQGGILAIRFTLTEAKYYLGYPVVKQAKKPGFEGFRGYRGSGISQEADRLLIAEAKHQQKLMDPKQKLNVLICEAVNKSEAYWNGVEIEKGNGMKRLYRPDNDEQMYYRLPPLEWNADGSPVNNTVVFENLQIAMAGHPRNIPVDRLEQILRKWWDSWYIRSRENFEDDKAWGKHKQLVYKILEEEIIQPIKGFKRVKFIFS